MVQHNKSSPQNTAHYSITVFFMSIVDVRVAYIRNLAFLGDRDHIVTANDNTVYCSYLQGPLDLNP